MVEGHSVHRVALGHRRKLCGKRFRATSPNQRFAEGAAAIDGQVFQRIIAIGKNLFAFFGDGSVIHVHFGMSGRWAIFETSSAPEPTPTTRLTLEGHGLTVHLSAMTVDHGDQAMFEEKRSKLGQDPLDSDADCEELWRRVSKSKKAISALLMDQAFFAGVGNIYRAEILFVARVRPTVKGSALSREEFDAVWRASVSLMEVGRDTGRITSISPEVAAELGDPDRRRYVYNQSHCIVCAGRVSNYTEASRTVWACLNCQTGGSHAAAAAADDDDAVEQQSRQPFKSHCAKESLESRLKNSLHKLSLKELKDELTRLGLPLSGKKAELIRRLSQHRADLQEHTADLDVSSSSSSAHGYHRSLVTGGHAAVRKKSTPSATRKKTTSAGSATAKRKREEAQQQVANEEAQQSASSERRRSRRLR